jgi:hypothetical protein
MRGMWEGKQALLKQHRASISSLCIKGIKTGLDACHSHASYWTQQVRKRQGHLSEEWLLIKEVAPHKDERLGVRQALGHGAAGEEGVGGTGRPLVGRSRAFTPAADVHVPTAERLLLPCVPFLPVRSSRPYGRCER